MTAPVCVIVGAGHAAAQLAPALRQQGWQGRIVMIGEEPVLPYHRPPLSKTFLSGDKDLSALLIRPAEAYAKADIDVRTGVRVEAIDREHKRLRLETGESLSWDKLALVTGGRVRPLPVPGAGLPGLFYVRNVADVEALRPEARRNRRAVIIGGGYIGLETAAMLRQMGLKVTVLEAAQRLLPRVTPPVMSAFFERLHQEEGVKIITCAQVSALGGEQRVTEVQCLDGRVFPADLVIAGIGIVPNVELALDAGLAVDDGILVDAACRTSDPDIVAAGDCTRFPSERYGGTLRLESIQNATDQARVAAATVCGQVNAYNALPWFWSDQYDVKFQIAGLMPNQDDCRTVVRGEAERGRRFAVFSLRDGVLQTVDAVNSPQEFMLGKRLIQAGAPVDERALADPAVPMKSLLD